MNFYLRASPSTPIQSSPPILQRYRILKQATLLSGMASIIVEHLPRGKKYDVYNNDTAAYLETQAIVQAFESSAVKSAGITSDFLEVGNEADLHVNNGGPMNPWGPTQYVAQRVTQILGTEIMFNVL